MENQVKILQDIWSTDIKSIRNVQTIRSKINKIGIIYNTSEVNSEVQVSQVKEMHKLGRSWNLRCKYYKWCKTRVR